MTHIKYKDDVSLSLRGGFDGTIEGIKTTLTVTDVKDAPLTIPGKEGMEGHFKFSKGAISGKGYLVMIVGDHDMWQVQVLATSGELNGADERVKASLRFE